MTMQVIEEAINTKMREYPNRQQGHPTVWVQQQGMSYKVGLFGAGEVNAAFGKLKAFIKPLPGTPALIDSRNFNLMFQMDSPAANLSGIVGILGFNARTWRSLFMQNKLGSAAQVVAALAKLDPTSLAKQMMGCFGEMTLSSEAYIQIYGIPNLVAPFQMPKADTPQTLNLNPSPTKKK